MLFGNEHESSPPLSRVAQVLFYITALAIVQDFRDNERKNNKILPLAGYFKFYFCEICHGLSLLDSTHFVLYAWSSFFALFLSYVNITIFLNFKMAAKRLF